MDISQKISLSAAAGGRTTNDTTSAAPKISSELLSLILQQECALKNQQSFRIGSRNNPPQPSTHRHDLGDDDEEAISSSGKSVLASSTQQQPTSSQVSVLRLDVLFWTNLKGLLGVGSATSSNLIELSDAIDLLGVRSAKAQNLNSSLTSVSRVFHGDGNASSSGHQRLYIALLQDGTVAGILKVGEKHLFLQNLGDKKSLLKDEDVLCVLDFYVHESLQRSGIGLELFQSMLKSELGPENAAGAIAYDRPSPKLVNFLAKHFKLVDGQLQANKFMVFKELFSSSSKRKEKQVTRNG